MSQAATTGTRRDPEPGPGSDDLLVPHAILPSPGCATECTSPWREGQNGGQPLHGQAAASADGHISQEADRLASPRVRRAAAARDLRSAGTAAPVPKYISSGVCP